MESIRNYFENFFELTARQLFRHRFKTLFVVMVFFFLIASNLPEIRVDVTTEGFLHKDDAALTAYTDFKREFGNDDLIIVGIESGNIFETGFLEKLQALHNALEETVPHMDDITSLINVRSTWGQGDELVVEDLLGHLPENQQKMDALRKRVLSTPLYKNLIISSDLKTTNIVIKLMPYASSLDEEAVMEGFDDVTEDTAWLSETEKSKAVMAVERVVKQFEAPDFRIYLSGSLSVNHFLKRMLPGDTKRFLRLAYLAVAICLVLVFKRASGVFIPLLVVTLSLFSTIGTMALLDVAIKLPTQILPSFLLAVSVGYSVHILALFYNSLGNGNAREDAVAHAMGHSGLPVLMTAVTTAAGLFSFATSEVAPVGELGIFAGAGVFFAMLYTFLLLPPLLSFVRIGKKRKKTGNQGRLDSFLIRIARMSTGHPGTVLIVSAILFATACMGLPRIKFSHDLLRWLPETEKIRMDTETLDRVMKGTMTLEVVIDTGMENGLHDPEFLKNLETVSKEIESLDTGEVATGKAWSIIEILKETNRALNENQTAFYSIPQTRALVSQELLLFENSGSDDLEDFTDSMFSKARLSVKLPFYDAVAYKAYISRVNRLLQKRLPDASVTTTGLMMIYSQVIAHGIRSMGISYGYALVAITFLMIFLIGNFRMGLVSMVPNLLPIVMILGIVGWLNIPMSLFVMLVGNIVIGLAVDDTIHFMHNFRKYYEEYDDPYMAVKKTFLSAGRAMLVTSCVLSTGFFIYLFSRMHHLNDFGFLTGAAIIIALVSDFIVAPAIMTLLFRTDPVPSRDNGGLATADVTFAAKKNIP